MLEARKTFDLRAAGEKKIGLRAAGVECQKWLRNNSRVDRDPLLFLKITNIKEIAQTLNDFLDFL